MDRRGGPAGLLRADQHDRLCKFIAETIKGRELRRLIRAWLDTETVVVERTGLFRREASRGILQGGVLSPLFANVYLDRFDKRVLKWGLKLVRYGDDMVVCCRSQEEAEATLKRIARLLARLDLRVNPRKTAIYHAEKGFRVLGRQLFLKTTGNGEPRLAGWPPRASRQPPPALPAISPPSTAESPADE